MKKLLPLFIPSGLQENYSAFQKHTHVHTAQRTRSTMDMKSIGSNNLVSTTFEKKIFSPYECLNLQLNKLSSAPITA